VRYAKVSFCLKDLLQLQKRLDLGFYEETLIFLLENFVDLIQGKGAPCLGELFGVLALTVVHGSASTWFHVYLAHYFPCHTHCVHDPSQQMKNFKDSTESFT
jgi:hypothetical protein